MSSCFSLLALCIYLGLCTNEEQRYTVYLLCQTVNIAHVANKASITILAMMHRRTSVGLMTSAAYTHTGRLAGLARIGWSGPARPAWLKAAVARFRCRPGRGISWRPAYSLL